METGMTVALMPDQLDTIRRRSAMRQLIDPRDAAGAVAYLLGPDGGRITGTVLTVDAGSTA
jgi:3-oxoacyl-[acyl-carrier protein] reductase